MSYPVQQEERATPTATLDDTPNRPAQVRRVLEALEQRGVQPRQVEAGYWRTRCPLHDNDDPAVLEIWVGDRDQVTLRCRGGDNLRRKCRTPELLNSLKLKPADLWPESPPEPEREELAWEPVTSDDPCNVCGGDSWCSRLEDGTVELCRRSPEAPDGRRGKEKDTNGNPYWVYRNPRGKSGKAPELFPPGFENMPLEPVVPGMPHRLSQKHLADLRASGLSDETIRAGGFFTTTSRHAGELLGWKNPDDSLGEVLVIPYRDASGNWTGYVRCKPDNPRPRKDKPGKVNKYEAPIGEPARIYFPPGTVAALKDPTARLLVVEGEKKCLAASQAGFPSIGISGVWNWQK